MVVAVLVSLKTTKNGYPTIGHVPKMETWEAARWKDMSAALRA